MMGLLFFFENKSLLREKLWTSYFQTVSQRTAGFNTVDSHKKRRYY